MYEPEPLPDSFVIELGRVVVLWNDVDFALNLLLNYLAGSGLMDIRGTIVFAHMTFPQKMHALEVLLRHTPSFAAAYQHHDLSHIVQLVKEASDTRNTLLHSRFSIKDGVILGTSVLARKRLELKERAFNPTEVPRQVGRIAIAAITLYRLVEEIASATEAPQDGQ